jgi:hypothetical protein
MKIRNQLLGSALALSMTLTPLVASASSHREAPFITKNPKIDATDFYMFNSYETGRAGYVTILANYLPLQDAYGGPNYFTLDPDAVYEVHIDNTGDGIEDVTFQFDFDAALNGGTGVKLDIGGKMVAVPLAAARLPDGTLIENVKESYKLNVIRGNRRTGTVSAAGMYDKPLDNIGSKTTPGYAAYADGFIKNFDVPGCTPVGVGAGTKARVFVGQRAEGFAVNLGEIFDSVNGGVANGPVMNLVGAADQGKNILAGANVTTLALEIPASCITKDAASPIVAAWTTASVRQARVINPTGTFAKPSREGGPWVQVSRLGMPLVNEVVIGLPDKNKFNGSEPKDDMQFADYVTNPTLPAILGILFGAAVPSVAAPMTPRTDLVTVFLQGVPGVNNIGLYEALRLNTTPALTTPAASQSAFGAVTCFDAPLNDTVGPTLNTAKVGCDPAGFPNGRRPFEDTVDIALRTVMGFLMPKNKAPGRDLPLVDGAFNAISKFRGTFPYLNTPSAGAPNQVGPN